MDDQAMNQIVSKRCCDWHVEESYVTRGKASDDFNVEFGDVASLMKWGSAMVVLCLIA